MRLGGEARSQGGAGPGEFFSAPPLVAVAILALNDRLLKARFPGAVTGKLSDVAGCFLLPLFLSALLAYATRWPLRLRLAAGAAATVLLFGAIKTSACAAAAVAHALSSAGAVLGLPRSAIVPDPTDLVALPFVALALLHGARAGRDDR